MTRLNIAPSTLFCGDNLAVLRGLNSACIDLIYLDPPFNKQRRFAAPPASPADGASFRDSVRPQDIHPAWRDAIQRAAPPLHALLDAIAALPHSEHQARYCLYMAIRLLECRRLLAPAGALFLHCDPSASHYLKLALDAVFGATRFRNEIIWAYPPGGRGPKRAFHRKHDVILFYGKSAEAGAFRRPHTPLDESATQKFSKTDEHGRRYKQFPRGRAYLDQSQGRPIPDWWTDIPSLGQTMGKESHGYPTQKPVALLERILQAASEEGDVVLDPFCGSATSCVAAERLGRRWVGIDISRQACDLALARLQRERALRARRGEDSPPGDITLATAPPQQDAPDSLPQDDSPP